jgi:DNA-binding CsgD family transcriptional regulator
VRSVARGEAVFGPKIADRVVGFFAAAVYGRGPEPFPQLTAREREILDLLARGWDNVTIARRLVVSDKTVRNHVSAVLTKLQVASRAEAVALDRDAGIGPAQLPTGSSTGQRPGRNPPDPAVAGPDPAPAGRAGPAADAGRRVTGTSESGLSLVPPRKPRVRPQPGPAPQAARQKTGLRPHWTQPHHDPAAGAPPGRHETRVQMRSNALEVQFHLRPERGPILMINLS